MRSTNRTILISVPRPDPDRAFVLRGFDFDEGIYLLPALEESNIAGWRKHQPKGEHLTTGNGKPETAEVLRRVQLEVGIKGKCDQCSVKPKEFAIFQ
jgi:hypothetical protein